MTATTVAVADRGGQHPSPGPRRRVGSRSMSPVLRGFDCATAIVSGSACRPARAEPYVSLPVSPAGPRPLIARVVAQHSVAPSAPAPLHLNVGVGHHRHLQPAVWG